MLIFESKLYFYPYDLKYMCVYISILTAAYFLGSHLLLILYIMITSYKDKSKGRNTISGCEVAQSPVQSTLLKISCMAVHPVRLKIERVSNELIKDSPQNALGQIQMSSVFISFSVFNSY